MSPRGATPEPADALAALDTLSARLLKVATQTTEAVREFAQSASAVRDLVHLAEAWEAEAGEPTPGPSGLARTAALRMCARQLREELAKGGATP